MSSIIFILVLGIIFTAILIWGFRTLPGERWQILATIPFMKGADGHWRGLNLTYYGLITATAYIISVALLYVLLGSIHIPFLLIFSLVCFTLMVCVPASSLIARIVEKKRHTFSVAAAFFTGVLVIPFIIWGLNQTIGQSLNHQIAFIPALAAISVIYAVGEGLGRLACISFGCCYGKSLSDCQPTVQKIFDRWAFTFLGNTKKIAYASNMEGIKVLPIQGLTAMLYVATALAGTYLFLNQMFLATFVMTMLVTQLWRLYSETLRADYRGQGKVSAYQLMAIISTVYAVAIGFFISDVPHPVPDLFAGLDLLWQPAMIIFLQVIWLTIFVYTGRSAVTESSVAISVCRDKI